MSLKNLSVEKRNKYENEFSEFLIKKIGNAGGSIQLQHVTGHMSQLRNEVKCVVGTTISDLKYFLKKHPNLFCINNNIVSLANSSALTTSGYDSDNSSIGPQTDLPLSIREGKGVVVKLFPSYGFIKSKDPIKTEIYFKASNFGDSDIDLTSFLYIGANVYFNAKKKNVSDESRCKYFAIRAWKADNSSPQDNVIIQKSRKNRETGLYDPLTLEGEGMIQNVFPNLGFIAVSGDETNTVFFYKSRVVNYDNIVDLTKVLSKGDVVEFNAHRSTKPDAKARWEATKVWKKSGKVKQNTCVSENSQCHKTSLSKQSISNTNNKAKEMKEDQSGKICPRSHGAVIKFGENELADGDSAQYFVCGAKVTEIAWEFSEGDDVKFDAVKIKSAPGWKAILVWVGDKPNIVLPTCLGDFSEFTDEENGEISSSIYTSKSSSCLSISSSSSLKSLSEKSESINSEKKDFTKAETSKLCYITGSEKIKDYKKSKIYYPSQNLRKDGENCSSKKFDNAVSNWGDSPYPDDDPENIYSSEHDASDSGSVENIHHNMIDVLENAQNITKHAISVEENSEKELNNFDFSNSDIKNNTDDSNIKLKVTASIKKFQNIEGKINKVYSKFAEVKSSNLQKNVSFFWNDFYTNGVPVEELELDDLKQVLKVGDTIHFNYFIIVDDSGQTWQKVSSAWNGSKPKIPIEMSPEDFIKQNGLSVTVNDEFDIDQVQEDKITSRKFLTSFIDVVPDQGNKVSKTVSCTEDKSLISLQNVRTRYNKTILPRDLKKLSSTICQLLKKDVLSSDSKVDLYSTSEEIIYIVLENCTGIKSDDDYSNTLPQDGSSVEKISDICLKCKEKCISSFSSQDITTRDCDVQTIITGEIIAQNIFPEC